MMRVIDIAEVNSRGWDSFVERHPSGSVFQTKEMYQLYCRTSNSMPIAFAVQDEGKVLGLVLANIVSNGGRLMKPYTTRSIINGGPLVLNNDAVVLSMLLSEYKKRLPWYVIYSEIRPIYDMEVLADTLSDNGFERIGHYNLKLDVQKEIMELWQQLHKERQRNIKSAEKNGLVFKEVESEEEMLNVKSLIEQTYRRKRVPMSNENMFVQLKQILGDKTRFFAAYYNGKMIAGQVRLCYRDMVYAWYAGSDDEFFKLRPNDFLMWNVICWAHSKGYRIFDFGGGGEPGVPYGVRDYKLKYGCELHDYGRFLLIHHPLIYSLGKQYANKVIKR